VHAAIVVIALATVSQNIYAHTGSLGDYGKKSILFKLTKPTDEEDLIVEGLPINSDIEPDTARASAIDTLDVAQVESYSTLGFVGGDSSPAADTGHTRTSIEYYVVQKGDTLGSISTEFGIGLETLLWANKLTARSFIRPGDRLTILPVSGVVHTVKKGDTLTAIASKYKADAEKIREFNHLAGANDLTVGQVLVVPEGRIIYVAPPPSAPAYAAGYAAPARSYESSGKLLWPVPSRRITQYFSWRHPAIDVGLPTGSEVVAADDGKIIYSGWGTGYGYEILIDHGNGMKTRYAHNSRLVVKAGDEVLRGQQIAYSGNTGWSTGPHLHFEVYSGLTRKNPLLYVK
jgi:LysM repeat protein